MHSFFKSLFIKLMITICILVCIVIIIDIFDCIKDSEKYMFGTESMIANGGIKYLCMSIYIFYSIMQFVIGLIACILLFKKSICILSHLYAYFY